MANYLINDTQLTSVADAIRAKSGGSAGLAFPSGFISEIGNISSGGGGTASSGNDVVFYDNLMNDCQGGIAYSYSAAEFAELTAMPANPDHSNFVTHGISIPMTSQGWNWSLADAKAYVAKYGKLNIGQTYIPTDGKSHWICHIPEDAPVERWKTEIHINVSGGSVNWQVDDGTTGTASGKISVTFPSIGWHDVKISAPSGVTYYPYYSSTNKTNELLGKIQKTIQVFLGSGVTKIDNNAFRQYYSLTSVTIPNSVTSIGSSAFYYCYSLTSVTIPDDVTSIDGSAFYSCYSLTSVTIPDSATSIGSHAFYYCYSLPSITIPDGVTSIGGSTFQNCHSLTSVTIPNSVTSIGPNVFYFCYSLTSITIPGDVTSIGGGAFQGCYSLTSITIPDDVTIIGSYTFNSCYSLVTITIPNSVTSIGEYAFQNCHSLTSITIPDGVTSISGSAFQSCYSLTSVTIPDSVTSIGSSAFQSCYSLATITIPNSVTSIGGGTFSSCYSLKNIIIESSTPPTLSNTNAFTSLMSDYSIIVPVGSLSTYTSETNWSSVASHIVEATA